MRGLAIEIGVLAKYLTERVGRPVADRTNLQGAWNLTAEWELKEFRPATEASFFSALEDQLGLKLEPGRNAENVLVIDAAELPGEN